MKAYILCKVNSGSERKVCKAIADYSNVTEVDLVFGEYDLIVEVRAENTQQLNFIVDKIRMVPSITLTSTFIVGRNVKSCYE